MAARILYLLIVLILTDTLLYFLLVRVFANIYYKQAFTRLHLSLTAAFLAFTVIFAAVIGDPGDNYKLFRSYFLWTDIYILIYIPKIILLFTLSPLLLFRFGRRPGRMEKSSHLIALRRKYLWIATSFFIPLLSVFILMDGMIRGPARFTVNRIELSFKDLPHSFDGLTIAQFSDIHMGSWFNNCHIIEALKTLQDENADIIVFTGDLINVSSEECNGFENAFRGLSALGGKYAVTGNHDFGDFHRLNREQKITKEIPALKKFYAEQHFNLLQNTFSVLHKGNDSIIIAGVDNWSSGHFKKFGDLGKAMQGIHGDPFILLLSHDPTHWSAEVVKDKRIDLTLSGHTHGGQMGISLFGYHWAPISLMYPLWSGVYANGEQYLKVNNGMGFVGFSCRIGIHPEITLITLHKE